MKTITLQAAFAILESASAVIVDNVVTYPSLDAITGEADNQFMNLSWTDEEARDFAMHFSEGKNQAVRVAGCALWMVDDDGDETQITILVPANLEANESPASKDAS